jgi:hypothetical protein
MPSVHEEVEIARRNGYLRGLRAVILQLCDDEGVPMSQEAATLLRRLEREFQRVRDGGALPG